MSYSLSGREIAVFDTDICLESMKIPKNFKVQDLTKQSFRCDKKSSSKKNARVRELGQHGEFVLDRLFALYKKEEELKIYYFSVFENKTMSEARIIEALKLLKDRQVEFILFAGGLPLEKNSYSAKLYSSKLFLLGTGQVGRGIKETTRLWPQNYSLKKMLVGYYKQAKSAPFQKMFAKGQLNEKKAYVFLPHRSKKSKLKYSSLAVSNIAGLILQNCNRISIHCLNEMLKAEKIDGREVRILREEYLGKI